MPNVRCRLVVLLAFAGQSQLADAQRPEPVVAPFSLTAVPAGTRVRLVDIRGQRLEGRVAAISDTVLWLRGDEATQGPLIRVRDIRTLDAHAAPASRSRTSLVSAGIGAVLGGLAGAAAHGDSGEGGPAGFGDPPGRAENITVGAALGAIVGWAVGRYAFGRARWQRVALP